MGSEYPDAIDYWVDRARVFAGMNSHSAIVLHCTGGGDGTQSVQQLGNYFRTNEFGTSTHFGIDRAGVVAQYVHLSDGAAGNCCVEAGHDSFWDQFPGANLNPHTISIECVNNDTNSLSLTEPQKQALFKLVAWLCEKYDLGPDQIKTHQSIAPINRKRCPGPAYPLEELIDYIGDHTMGVPTGWKDENGVLTAPSEVPGVPGKQVVRGFREYILTHAWDPSDIPEEEEHGASPVEAFYPSENGTIQTFRYTRLGWTPKRGVYRVGIGNELLGNERTRVAQVQTIAAQQRKIDELETRASMPYVEALETKLDAVRKALG